MNKGNCYKQMFHMGNNTSDTKALQIGVILKFQKKNKN